MLIPKAELHAHLEGTISPELALKLAKRNNITLPIERINVKESTYIYQDFLDFLHTYDIIAEVIKDPTDYYDITFDYLARSARQGGIYTELMYSPDHAEKSSGIPSTAHLEAIQQAIYDAEKQFHIIGTIITTAVRHFGSESAIKVAKEAIKHPFPCVVGFGLGGDEINYPPEMFTEAYKIAREGGLFCTVHAGEFLPAKSMQQAIKHLPIQRIGHGIQAIHCAETQAMLKDKNITLEVCPTSNVKLGLVESIAEHPLPGLMKAGINVCINTDDPPFFGTDLSKEYTVTQHTFKFSDEEMVTLTKNAIDAAFVDEKTKQKLYAKLSKSYSPA